MVLVSESGWQPRSPPIPLIHPSPIPPLATTDFLLLPCSFLDFPSGTGGKESTRQCRRHKRPSVQSLDQEDALEEGIGHSPLQYSCLENPHGQRNLAGYSPWGLKELDTTEVT